MTTAIGIESAIPETLFARVHSLAQTLGLPVAWPLRVFNPPDNSEWLEVRHFPNDTLSPFLAPNDEKHYQGILQVAVTARRGPSIDLIRLNNLAAELVEGLRDGVILDGDGLRVKVTSQPSVAAVVEDNDKVFVPVSVPYNVEN